MVRRGQFKLEIINVETGKPFKEHNDAEGNTYLEVEPDSEYFLQIQNDSPYHIYVSVYIDDEKLGYARKIDCKHSSKFGIRNVKDGISTYSALKFDRLSHSSSNSCRPDKSSDLHIYGTMKVKIYSVHICNDPRSRHITDITNKWKGRIEDSALLNDHLPAKKILRSRIGTKTISTRDYGLQTEKTRRWSKGNHVQTIEIQYCSTPGLICKGILPGLATPNSLLDRYPNQMSAKRQKLCIDPEIIRNFSQDATGNVIKETEIEMFDLTHIQTSDDETNVGS